MAYNRWLAHHGINDQKWGVKNGPPYPLDRSVSDGHKLIKSNGSPQSKKKYKTSEKTAHKRAERKARTDKELDRARKLYGKDDISKEELAAIKPQKKSISSRINSLMDRVFGNSIKAQEKGQKKIDVNFEPVTSEKAKTKRGETYEINDWNGDAQDTIKAFKSNPEPHISVARKAALQEARRIIGWYAKDNPEAQRFLSMSDQQLSKRIGLDFVSAYSHGTVEFSFGDAGTGDFLGHEVDVEYDLNRRKVMNVSVNG